MSPAHARSAIVRLARRDRLGLWVTLVLYSSMIVWSAFAIGRDGPMIMVPSALLAGAWIWSRVRPRIRRAEVALAADADPRPLYAERLDRTVVVKRWFRWIAPALVALSLGGAAIVVGRHGNFVYWAGGFAVGVALLAAAIHAHVSLRRDVATRAAIGRI